ncbi:MAG: bifunctional UDP-N-acetylglucosamine diphosphorylase/glucosamine-1-phosphate N-acetyltransferase GlmU [Desulfohalobiaceae bacterium]|nr:bifunctional UDP-N-acetylglucosamine diphosphorylase/glucosamine-1-phosphate N-acetyltransferase GlmU [Desulfohalobiaceae bacterium]
MSEIQRNDRESVPFQDVCGLILAAGKGTRMQSDSPKVLQTLLETPMLWYVYRTMDRLFESEKINTVVGYKQELVHDLFQDRAAGFIVQNEQLGTGHALQCSLEALSRHASPWCLVVNGDVPLIKPEPLASLILETRRQQALLGFLTLELDQPSGYGRVHRDKEGRVLSILEEKDIAGNDQLMMIQEVNSGIYCLNLAGIEPYVKKLTNNNQQAEYYITQLVDLLVRDRKNVAAVKGGADQHFLGVNSPRELVQSEEIIRQELVEHWLDRGVVVHNPDQVRIAPTVVIDPGVEITGPLELHGQSYVQRGTRLDSHVWIKDSRLGPGAWVRNFSHLEGVRVGQNCRVGPFARLRPGAELKAEARAGNFVEIKKAVLDKGCKVNHLSYIGDAYLGEEVNVGAGTITCNYDGRNKHLTHVGKQSFIGSNTALVAPVKVGENSLIGAGSVVTRDVPEETLAVTRARQKHLVRKKTREDGKD